jgi:hypothetical protein
MPPQVAGESKPGGSKLVAQPSATDTRSRRTRWHVHPRPRLAGTTWRAMDTSTKPVGSGAEEAELTARLDRLNLEQKVRLLTGVDLWALNPEPAIG